MVESMWGGYDVEGTGSSGSADYMCIGVEELRREKKVL
jgi:hypothetical protein